MQAKAWQYLAVETASSWLCNGMLNFASAFAIFHGRTRIPATGLRGLVGDTIGETFIVTALSVLIPSLIARKRRRTGTLPVSGDGHTAPAGNLYVRAMVTALIFTCVCVPFNAFLLPRIFTDGVSFRNVLLFKTLYGAVIGSIATALAVRKALHEVD